MPEPATDRRCITTSGDCGSPLDSIAQWAFAPLATLDPGHSRPRTLDRCFGTGFENSYDNELVELAHVRGAVAGDLHGAFKEWEVQARSLTKCSKYLYSLSINPDPAQGPLTREQYMAYVRRAEGTLGLAEQPRAIVFHTKYGREHCHVVWSRIDADNQRAVHLAFDRDKLMRVTRDFARDHGLSLPPGYERSRQAGQVSLYEQEQARQTGLSKTDHIQAVTEAWRHSDDAHSFVQALSERGYLLATGKRPYVVVDLYGNMNALPKLIEDKSIRTADIRRFLEKDFPVESLPSVEEARELVASHRKLVEKSLDEDRYASQLAALKHAQQDRRHELEQSAAQLRERHHELRADQQTQHRAEREALRARHREAMKETRRKRIESRPTGLAAFLGRVSGVTLIRRILERREDGRQVKQYVERKRELKVQQEQERRALAPRLELQARAERRKLRTLQKVDKREVAALMRDCQASQRTRVRTGGWMPSLNEVVMQQKTPSPHLGHRFEMAARQHEASAPDVLAAFKLAAGQDAGNARGDTVGQTVLDTAPPEISSPKRGGRESNSSRQR